MQCHRAIRPAIFGDGLRLFAAAIALFNVSCTSFGDARNTEELDAYVRAIMAERRIPGLSLAVVRRGRIETVASYGHANIEFAVPVSSTTLFHVASVTKSFTAVGIMQLVDSGRLRLSDSIGTYLEQLPDEWREVTIRDLLSHTSGLPDIFPNGSPGPLARTLEEALAILRDKEMQFEPGSRYLYNQTDSMLLGLLIEELSGLTYAEYCRLHLFAPVGLSDPSFGGTQTLIMNRSPIYTPFGAADERPATDAPELRVLNFSNSSMMYPNNGLNISAPELGRWLIALMRSELISQSSLNLLMEPLRLSDGSLSEFPPSPAYPWRVATVGGLLGVPDTEHPAVGGTGGPYAAYLLYPDDELAIVVLTNTQEANPDSIVSDIAQMYL